MVATDKDVVALYNLELNTPRDSHQRRFHDLEYFLHEMDRTSGRDRELRTRRFALNRVSGPNTRTGVLISYGRTSRDGTDHRKARGVRSGRDPDDNWYSRAMKLRLVSLLRCIVTCIDTNSHVGIRYSISI